MAAAVCAAHRKWLLKSFVSRKRVISKISPEKFIAMIKENWVLVLSLLVSFQFDFVVRLFASTTTAVYNFHLKLPIKYIFVDFVRTFYATFTRSLPHIFKWIWTEKKDRRWQQAEQKKNGSRTEPPREREVVCIRATMAAHLSMCASV